jgi:hypothetical protein
MQGSHSHRSRLAAALVDVPATLYEEETAFWTGALGIPPDVDPGDPDYASFGEAVPGLQFHVQRVDAAPRVHLDIETDDVEAEFKRLETPGAMRVCQVETWWVMRDPAGLLFCVVRIQCPDAFEQAATRWGDGPARRSTRQCS